MTQGEFQGKTALVTGAASGIGRAIAVMLAERGARVAAADRDRDGVAALAAGNDNVEGFTFDLTDLDSVVALRRDVEERLGLPDVLVNAAGFDKGEPFLQNTDEFWTRLLEVNYQGVLRVCHTFLTPIVDAGRSCSVVNIGSDAGRVGSIGETAYAGTKGAVIAFTKSLAREMARYRINVNCVCPGPTDTPLFNDLIPDKVKSALVKAIPFGRVAQPEEIAEAVLFLAGDRSRYITGQVLSVSGGLTMVD